METVATVCNNKCFTINFIKLNKIVVNFNVSFERNFNISGCCILLSYLTNIYVDASELIYGATLNCNCNMFAFRECILILISFDGCCDFN